MWHDTPALPKEHKRLRTQRIQTSIRKDGILLGGPARAPDLIVGTSAPNCSHFYETCLNELQIKSTPKQNAELLSGFSRHKKWPQSFQSMISFFMNFKDKNCQWQGNSECHENLLLLHLISEKMVNILNFMTSLVWKSQNQILDYTNNHSTVSLKWLKCFLWLSHDWCFCA